MHKLKILCQGGLNALGILYQSTLEWCRDYMAGANDDYDDKSDYD